MYCIFAILTNYYTSPFYPMCLKNLSRKFYPTRMMVVSNTEKTNIRNNLVKPFIAEQRTIFSHNIHFAHIILRQKTAFNIASINQFIFIIVFKEIETILEIFDFSNSFWKKFVAVLIQQIV